MKLLRNCLDETIFNRFNSKLSDSFVGATLAVALIAGKTVRGKPYPYNTS